MATRSEKLRRRQKRKEKKRRRTGWAEPTGPELVFNPRGEIKMSEVLLELVEPEWDECRGKDAMEKLLTLGMIGWNAALYTGAKRAEFVNEMAGTVPADAHTDFAEIVAMYVRRKEASFPHIRRPMISFELTLLPSGEPYVVVVSGLSP